MILIPVSDFSIPFEKYTQPQRDQEEEMLKFEWIESWGHFSMNIRGKFTLFLKK